MAKLLKLRRGTTTQHASFTGAEGEVTIDTTKDTAVVHDGAQAGGRPLAREDMNNVSSSTVVSRIGTSALAGVKVQPNFGSQNVETIGDIVIGGANPKLQLVDSGQNPDWQVENDDGTFRITDTTNDSTKLRIDTSGNVLIPNNLDANGGIDVSGNITCTGTVDGVDVAGQNTLMRSVVLGSGNLANSVTVNTTPAQSDNSTKVATTAYVKTAVANVVDSAPGALDTLNELAAALGDDANYATTTATSIGTKLPKSGGQMTGNITMSGSQTVDGRDLSVDGSKLDGIESGATADQTKSDIDGLNINADQVDGLHAADFLRSNANDTAYGDITFDGGTGAITMNANSDIRFVSGSWTGDYSCKLQHHANIFYIQGGSAGHQFRTTSGASGLSIDASGNCVASGNVTAYSDVRLKTDIHTINDALGICGKLRGVSYKWIRDGKPSIGVIAQEVEEVIPEVVLTSHDVDPSTGEVEEIKSVDYGKIVGVLINAINELKAEVDELKGGK